jgi:L-ascorbate metabolism protein UlaG (beta-lactamase superfamily)
MKLTKFTHSCVRIEDDNDRRLVIDPGSFSEVEQALADVDAVLITHQHADHVDVQRLAAVARANPDLRVWAPRDVADQLAAVEALAGRVTVVGPGESLVAGGLRVRTFGGQHALIHSSVPVVSNICYLVGEAVYHPGDSYVVPTAAVETLLVPLNAPWAKLSETLDFTISVRAPRAIGIHDALLGDIGRNGYGSHLQRIGELYGATAYTPLAAHDAIEL